MIVIDAAPNEHSAVVTFRLGDVVNAAQVVFAECLVRKGAIGIEFPADAGPVFAKMERLDAVPPGVLQPGSRQLGREKGDGVRRVQLPDGRGVLHIVDGLPGWRDGKSGTSREIGTT